MTKFTEDHEGLNVANGVANVGITSHAVELKLDLPAGADALMDEAAYLALVA